ncbi:sugar phosphate nucleotidyltransferase [Soonwooa sp.]|uniref:nucleotidyltransferase family protein n=1 Tax=Soonwooa sp. TaxID=1938592 RepID=UPI00261F2A03|nr:sugar phosphate nucleotidyltransferase [Soonwooa sp.]
MNSNKTLVIMAGGLGSRYKGLKQVDGITDNNSPILEYSMYDALEAGFNKIVVILNRKIPTSFIDRLEKIAIDKNIDLQWIFQDIDDHLPENYNRGNREKPWGTGHALLCVKDLVKDAFVVINADDFYGKEIYKKAANIINSEKIQDHQFSIIAYPLHATLSDNGSVSRGICEYNDKDYLEKVTERTQIFKENGKAFFKDEDKIEEVSLDTLVSMNYSIFHSSIFEHLEYYFEKFLNKNPHEKAEYLIPNVIQNLIEADKAKILIYESPSEWMGVTYPEDKALLKAFIEEKIKAGDYPKDLWN